MPALIALAVMAIVGVHILPPPDHSDLYLRDLF